jgi:hypothetical protein
MEAVKVSVWTQSADFQLEKDFPARDAGKSALTDLGDRLKEAQVPVL